MTKKLTFEEFKELFPKTYNQGFMKNADNVKIDGENYNIFRFKSLDTGETHYSFDPHFFRVDLSGEEQLEKIYKDFYYKFSQEGK